MNATRYCTECEIELTDDNTNNKDDTTCDECFSKIMNDTDCEYSNFQEDQDMDNYYENKYGR
jgi:DNA-directed RNA polymerase subunit RPC12/RpoP